MTSSHQHYKVIHTYAQHIKILNPLNSRVQPEIHYKQGIVALSERFNKFLIVTHFHDIYNQQYFVLQNKSTMSKIPLELSSK